MPFINKRLGNGFVIKSIDSTKDQEHYFGGSKKYININISTAPLNSGSATNGPPDITSHYDGENKIYYLTGSTESDRPIISASFYIGKVQELVLASSDKYPNMFSYFLNYDKNINRVVTNLSFEVSQSQTSGTPATLTLEVGTPIPYFYVNIGDNFDVTSFFPFEEDDLSNGWKKISTNNITGVITPLSGFSVELEWVGGEPDVIAIRNIQLDLLQPLSDSGVEAFKNFDDQTLEKQCSYLNTDIFKKIE